MNQPPLFDRTESALNPRVVLATTVHGQEGVYALLLGSGASTGAGIPTGWGVVNELVRRIAAANGDDPGEDFDPEAWWAEHRPGVEQGYSNLLQELAPTAASRRALLADFFEAREDERGEGQRVPGPAHHAIAKLVERRFVRVIVTTNFDHLIEQALDAAGIAHQVVASASSIQGMEPLPHARCTVIKLHGDYTRIDQLNTVEELSEYAPEMRVLLDRVLDEYGLIINGWSGDWDHALVDAIAGTRSRRYPMFWSYLGPLGATGRRLADRHRAILVPDGRADEFFPDLVRRLEALDMLGQAPMGRHIALARFKRALPDPVRHIEVRDQLMDATRVIIEYVEARPRHVGTKPMEEWSAELAALRARTDKLLELAATGILLDRDRQHDRLWAELIERLLRCPPRLQNGTSTPAWTALDLYPALLVLTTAVVAATAAGREDLVIRVLRQPTRQNPHRWREEPAFVALEPSAVINAQLIPGPTPSERWMQPHSHYLRETLEPTLRPLLGGSAESYAEAFGRAEYRRALIHVVLEDDHPPPGGEFLLDGNWRDDGFSWEQDFRARADKAPWAAQVSCSGGDSAEECLDAKLTELTKMLRDHRRYSRW